MKENFKELGTGLLLSHYIIQLYSNCKMEMQHMDLQSCKYCIAVTMSFCTRRSHEKIPVPLG